MATTRERLIIEGRRRFESLLHDAGGTHSAVDVGRLLGIQPDSVRKLRYRGKLLAIKCGNKYLYPVWQLTEAGKIVANFPETLQLLSDSDPIDQFRFFLSPAYELHEKSPIEWLMDGRDPAPVFALARQFERQGAR